MKIKSRLRERVKQAIKRRQDEGGSTKYVNIPADARWFEPQKVVKIDIIPYVVSIPNHPDGAEPGELYWVMPYKMHSSIGSDDKTFVCPRTWGEKCPICEYRAQLIREDYDANKDLIDQLKARDRMLLQVIDVDDRAAGIQLWDVSYFLFGRKLENELVNAEDESYYDFAELKGGYTLKVRFEEKHFGNFTFWEADRIDFLPREKDYDESILKQGYQLDKLLRYVDPKMLEDIFYDKVPYTVVFSDASKEDDEENDTPEQVSPAKKPSTRQAPPPEDDVPDEKIIDDEVTDSQIDTSTDEKLDVVNEEEQAPRRRRRKTDNEDSKCPFGYRFGVDTDLYPECDKCPDDVWEACSAAFAKNGGN